MTKLWLAIIFLLSGSIVAAGWTIRSQRDTILKTSAELTTVRADLDAKKADLEISKINSDRMLAEKDAELTAERRRAAVDMLIQTNFAGTKKDIANATDSKKCTDSDPVRAALDGMRRLEKAGPILRADDPLPPASRVGKAAKPGFAAGPGAIVRRQGAR